MPETHTPPHPPTEVGREEDGLAPPWHTAALVGLILAVALTGALLASGRGGIALLPAPASRSSEYLLVIAVQWSLALYVCRVGRCSVLAEAPP